MLLIFLLALFFSNIHLLNAYLDEFSGVFQRPKWSSVI